MRNSANMPVTFEIFILLLTAVMVLLQVITTTGAGGVKLEKIKEEKYVQYVNSKPILSMPSGNVQFDGDVYYASDEIPWDFNDSHQLPSGNSALYIADPFINIQNAPGQFQPMI